MNFPLKSAADSCQIPEDSSCLGCGRKIGEVEGFIRLTTGAILYGSKKRDWGGPSDKMDSIFKLWYHGPHPVVGKTNDGRLMIGMNNKEFRMDVVEPVPGGQVDIHFCSTPCLSSFFANVVAEFDGGIKNVELGGDNSARNSPDV